MTIALQPASDKLPAQNQRASHKEALMRRRYQRGTILESQSGWSLQYGEYETGADGRQVRRLRVKWLGSKQDIRTKRAAREIADRFLSDLGINRPNYRSARVIRFDEFVRMWERDVMPLLKSSTQRASVSHLKQHIKPQFAGLMLDQVGPEEVQKLVGRLAQKLSRKTVKNIVGTLTSMLGTAKRWGYLITPVSVNDLRLPNRGLTRPPRYFTADEVQRICQSAGEPWRTMYFLLATTGLRAGELLGLRKQDLDFTHNLIFIRQSAWHGKIQTPKTRRSEAALPFPPTLQERMKWYLECVWRKTDSDLLFPTNEGTPYWDTKVRQEKLQPLLKHLGIERAGLHAFRHTTSTLMAADGAPETVRQAQLRHEDSRTTQIYTHTIPPQQMEYAERLAQMLAKEPKLATEVRQ